MTCFISVLFCSGAKAERKVSDIPTGDWGLFVRIQIQNRFQGQTWNTLLGYHSCYPLAKYSEKTLVNKLLFTLQHFWSCANCSAVVPDTFDCRGAVVASHADVLRLVTWGGTRDKPNWRISAWEAKGRFTRYDFVAYDKLTTGLRHDLGPFSEL